MAGVAEADLVLAPESGIPPEGVEIAYRESPGVLQPEEPRRAGPPQERRDEPDQRAARAAPEPLLAHPPPPPSAAPPRGPAAGTTIIIDPSAPFRPLGPRPDALRRAAEFLTFWLGPLLRKARLPPL